jgi:ATP-dependent protease HslVU (ClpYQ) peptidase subunit
VTTVAAVAAAGSVWMCADSMTNVFDRRMPGAARKIMRLEARSVPMLIGTSGNAGMTGRLRAAWNAEEAPLLPNEASAEQLQDWADEVSTLLTQPILDAGMVDADGRMDGHFLLGAAGNIWTIYHHAAIRHADGRAAVGTGEGLVLGALDVMLGAGEAPEVALQRAVEIACARDLWSGLPMQFEVLPAAQQ